MTYRPEIDGLRTIAVMPVILFHAGFSIFQGGFIGVDVFFVISGYLITTILIGELERNDFSILRFYERRARRILPALFTVILCTIPPAWIALDPLLFTDFSESIVATILFGSNFLFWLESGYFDTEAENKPLLHTWSLAVEEQYYIFFPVMLFLLWRYGRRPTLGTITILALASFVLCLWGARNASSANFYLLPFRMWELFVGSICAFLVTGGMVSARGHQALAGLGLGLVVGSIFLISADMPFPGAVTLGPVFGTALIILFARPGTLVARLLSVPAMVGIGLISYSLYLWHQPIFALARLQLKGGHALELPTMALLIGLTFVLSILTWRFVEQPFRKRRDGTRLLAARLRLFTASAGAMAAFAAFGLFGVVTDGAAMRYPPNYATLVASFDDRSGLPCKFEPNLPIPARHPVAECMVLAGDGEGDTVMILGDSHAWAMSQGISEALAEAGLNSYVMTYAACPPVPEIYLIEADRPEECHRFVIDALNWAKAAGIQQIVIAARFTAHIHGSGFDNGEGGLETGPGPDRVLDAVWDGSRSIPAREARLARIREAIPARLAAMSLDFDLIVLEPVPEAGWHVPRRGIEILERTDAMPHLTTSYDVVRARTEPVQEMLQEIFDHDHGHVDLVPVKDLFCDPETGRCDNIVDGQVLYYDDDHVSNTGARLIAPRVVSAVEAARSGS